MAPDDSTVLADPEGDLIGDPSGNVVGLPSTTVPVQTVLPTQQFFAVEVSAFKPGSSGFTFDEGHGTHPHGTLAQFPDEIEASGTIYASDLGYRSASTDIDPTRPYPPLLDQAFQMVRQMNVDPADSAVAAAWGTINLTNADRRFDSIAASWNSDGRQVRILAGSKTLDPTLFIFADPEYSALSTFFVGIAQTWFLSDTQLQIPIRDATYWLETPLQSTTYDGSGTYGGNDALIGKPKPKARGGTGANPIRNITPTLIDPTNLIYQYNDGAGTVVSLYEGGATDITFASDTTDLYSGVTPAGQYRTDNSRGLFQLGSTPVRAITADVTGEFPVAGAVTTICAIAQYLMSEDLELPAGNIDVSSFQTANAAYPYTGGIYFSSDVNPDGVTAVGQVLGSIGAKLYPSFGGQLRVLVLRAIPDGTAPILVIDDTNAVSVTPVPLPTTLAPPIYRARVGYSHNYTVQTSGLNPTLTSTQLQDLAAADKYASSSSSTILTSYLHPNDLAPIVGAVLAKADAQSVADDLISLFAGRVRIYDVAMPRSAVLTGGGVLESDSGAELQSDTGAILVSGAPIDISDVVRIIWPMDDLGFGKLGQIIGESFTSSDDTLTLRVLV